MGDSFKGIHWMIEIGKGRLLRTDGKLEDGTEYVTKTVLWFHMMNIIHVQGIIKLRRSGQIGNV